MRWVVRASIEYVAPLRGRKLAFIHIYISGHLKTAEYSYARVRGSEGTFELSFDVPHPSVGIPQIPQGTLLCFDLYREIKDENSCTGALGYCCIGCSEVLLGRVYFACSPSILRTNNARAGVGARSGTVRPGPGFESEVVDRYDPNVADEIHAGYIVVHGMSVEIVGGPCSVADFPKSIGPVPNDYLVDAKLPTRAQASILIERSLAIFDQPTTRGKISVDGPLYPQLSRIHCPSYNQARCLNVGCAYAMRKLQWKSDENFFSKMLRVALKRFGVSKQWFVETVEGQSKVGSDAVLPGYPLAVAIAARALCVYACSNKYVTDTSDEYLPDGGGFEREVDSDRYTTMRIAECDDCEGKAEEIMFEFTELVSTRESRGWKTKLVQCFADSVRYYVPMMVHCSVNSADANAAKMMKDESNRSFAPAKRGTSGKEAPCWIPSTAHPDNVAGFPTIKGKELRNAADRMRAMAGASEALCHVYVVLDPIPIFVACLEENARKYLRPNMTDGTTPKWVARLPRLFLEGTAPTFPLHFPLGLLYEPGSVSRGRAEEWQKNTHLARRRLEQNHPALALMTTLIVQDKHGCLKRDVMKSVCESAPEQFYWVNVAAYTPTVCPDVNGTVFREVAYVQDGHYGALTSILSLMHTEPTVINYVPTLLWGNAESDMVDERLKLEAPVPPMHRASKRERVGVQKREEYQLLQEMKLLESNLKSSLASPIQYGPRPSTDASRELATQGIPLDSHFHGYVSCNGAPVAFVTYEIPSEYLRKSGTNYIKKTLSDVVANRNNSIRDVYIKIHYLGKPAAAPDDIRIADVTFVVEC